MTSIFQQPRGEIQRERPRENQDEDEENEIIPATFLRPYTVQSYLLQLRLLQLRTCTYKIVRVCIKCINIYMHVARIIIIILSDLYFLHPNSKIPVIRLILGQLQVLLQVSKVSLRFPM